MNEDQVEREAGKALATLKKCLKHQWYAHRKGVCLFTPPGRTGTCQGFRADPDGGVWYEEWTQNEAGQLFQEKYRISEDLTAAARQLIQEAQRHG